MSDCQGCTNRHPHCHSECEIYKAFKAERERINKIRQQEINKYICDKNFKRKKHYKYYDNREEN